LPKATPPGQLWIGVIYDGGQGHDLNPSCNGLLQLRLPKWGGRLLVSDARRLSPRFRGSDSLKALWRNIALLP
jgi:hypothetical protein